MKQDIFNLTTIFNHDEPINVQVHNSLKDELLKEIGDLQKYANKIAR